MSKSEANPAKTVLIVSVGFIIVYLVTGGRWALFVSLGVGLIGAFSDYLSRKLDFLWMKLALVLSLIVPNVILGLVYYVILFPISVLSRTLGNRDPLKLKKTNESTFKSMDKTFEKTSFEKPW